MNVREIERDGKTYVFITRGRSSPFSDDEIEKYLSKENSDNCQFVPDTRERKIMFIKDLSMGLEFCAQKYNVTIEDVVAEANRVAPHMNVRQ